MINVTKSTVPPLEEYIQYLQGIWERNHFTNHGCLVNELEEKLKAYLQANHFYYVSNGTVALQLAIRALDLSGEILTTPFSYVATTASIAWEHCKPVFVDIDPETLTIDPDKLEAAITNKTQAILATHVYGNPCDVERIEQIARSHGLAVIYDAAHCFGVTYQSQPITHYGDISTLSFHATKLFHTVEGGGVVTRNDDLAHKISYLMNFGHNGPEAFFGLGINAKNSELHAAMGLCNLPRVNAVIEGRKAVSDLYDSLLLPTGLITRPRIRSGTEYNYAYYPVLFASEADLLKVKQELVKHNINTRRYFYPSLSQLDYVGNQPVPITEDIAKRVLCLPLFDSLPHEIVSEVSNIIVNTLSHVMI